MVNIFLFGCSGHAAVVLDILRKQGLYSVAGIIDSFAEPGSSALGLPVLGNERNLARLVVEFNVSAGIVAIGDNFTRHAMVERVLAVAPDFQFVSAVHPSAQTGTNVCIGAGTVVMAGSVINPNSSIGDHCIVNTGCSIDHDNVFGNFSSIAPGSHTGGNVRVGEFSVLALQAGVVHGRTIGAHSVVGAGALVLHDVPAFAVAYGTPARVIRTRKAGERYL